MNEAVLQGNLRIMHLADVLQWLLHGMKTGILHVRSPEGILKTISLKEGNVWYSASSEPREYLGQFLISRGYLSERELNEAMEEQLRTGVRLGQILVRDGLLEEEQLNDMLRLKARECLFSLFLWDSGDFYFEELPEIDETMVPLSLDLMSITMEGVRRRDEWKRIRDHIPSCRIVPARTDASVDEAGSDPASLAMRVYLAVDGKRCVEDIALHLHSTEFDVSAVLYVLITQGTITVKGAKPTLREEMLAAVLEKMIGQAAQSLAEGSFREAENLYRYLLRHRPSEPRILEGLRKAEEGIARKFFEEHVPMFAILEPAVSLENLSEEDLTSQEGYLISRIDGTWDLGSILKVSPLPEVEVLKAIQRLLEKGLVRVRPR